MKRFASHNAPKVRQTCKKVIPTAILLCFILLLTGCRYTEISGKLVYDSWQEYVEAASVDLWTDELPPPYVYYYVFDDSDIYQSTQFIDKIIINDDQVQTYIEYPYWSIIADRKTGGGESGLDNAIKNGAVLMHLENGSQYALKEDVIQGNIVYTYYFTDMDIFMTVQCRKDIADKYGDSFILNRLCSNSPRLPQSPCF